MPTLSVCVPTRGSCRINFASSLARLMQRGTADGFTLTLRINEATPLDMGRDMLCADAFTAGDDGVLFLDDDMVFPADALTRLWAHGVPLVGTNYPRRKEGGLTAGAVGCQSRLVTGPTSTGLVTSGFFGLGCALIRREVFSALSRPWFYFTTRFGRLGGEDFNFCQRALGQGFTPYVDQDLSREIGHICVEIRTVGAH